VSVAPWVAIVAAWLWGLNAPPARARAAVTLVVAMTAADVALKWWVPHGVPWTGWAWQLARALAVLAAWAFVRRFGASVQHRERFMRGVSAALLVATGAVGALFVREVARCVGEAQGDPERNVDAVVVLGFGLLQGGRLAEPFVARIERGVRYYREGRARLVVFTGAQGTYGPAESIAAMEAARGMGLPESAMLYEDRSHSTRENMIEAAKVLRAHDLRSIAVVSDTFHLARARRFARDQGYEPVMIAAVSRAWTDRRRATFWVLRESALLVVDDVRRAGRWATRGVSGAW
jgi:uncharacterized SAM-binding protein YcdF (DUF218 family)